MTDLRKAAQQALDYMKSVGQMDMYPEDWAIVERLEAALAEPQSTHSADCYKWHHECAIARIERKAEPVQEPVAWMHTNGVGHVYFRKKPQDKVFNPRPVYLKDE